MKSRSALPRLEDAFPTMQVQRGELEYATVLMSPDTRPNGTEGAAEHISRWEDHGGPVFDAPDPFPQVADTSTPRPKDAVGDGLPYDEPDKKPRK